MSSGAGTRLDTFVGRRREPTRTATKTDDLFGVDATCGAAIDGVRSDRQTLHRGSHGAD
jgi:hypothetical protein